jgi:hypothetical protein
MKVYRSILAGLLVLSFAPASAQVRTAVPGLAAARQALSDTQAHELSKAIAQRPAAATLNLDPGKVAAAAGPQAAPVKLNGAQLVPAAPVASPAVTSKAPAELQVIKTSAAEEKLLTGAIAGNDRIRAALSNPASSLITLPGVVRVSAEGAPTLQLKPFIFVNQPLQRDSSGLFKGELLIGVSEIADTGSTKSLPTPLLFQVVGAAKSEPARVLVDSTSPPFRTVEVWLSAVQGAVAKLLVVSVFDHQGTQVELPVATELDVDTGNGNIAGLGIETTKVMVSLNNAGNAAGRVVTLHVQPSGYLDNSRLILDASGTAMAELRSGSVGSAQIRATSPGLAPVTATVNYTLPWLTVLASILGGLLGGGANLLIKPDPNKGAARRLAGATLWGVLVVAAYIIGINFLPFTPAVTVGALFVFAFSAIAAWFGPK